ncbi:hypothetical protein ACTFIY_010496 [Dictyostelium cf. discoideum]
MAVKSPALCPNTASEEIIPERFKFSISNPKTYGNHTQLVHFGIGVRDCIGKALSDSVLFTVLVNILHRYEFVNPNPSNPIQVCSIEMANQPNNSFILLRKRKN